MVNSRNETESNPQLTRAIFTIDALEKCEEKFGQKELNKFLDRCPYLQIQQKKDESKEKIDYNQKKSHELKEYNKYIFAIWVISSEIALQDRILRELMLKAYYSEILEEDFKREINKEKFEKRMRDLVNLSQFNIEKLQAISIATIKFLRNEIGNKIYALASLRDSLKEIFKKQQSLVNLIKENAFSAFIDLYKSLPKMDEAHEKLRNEVLAQVNHFLHNPEKLPIENFLRYIQPQKEKILTFLRDPENQYSSQTISNFEKAHKEKEKSLSLGNVIEKSNRKLEDAIDKIDKAVKESEAMNKNLEYMQENPGYEPTEIIKEIKKYSDINLRQTENLNQARTEFIIENDTIKSLSQEVKGLNPHLASDIDSINDSRGNLVEIMAIELSGDKKIEKKERSNKFDDDLEDDNDYKPSFPRP